MNKSFILAGVVFLFSVHITGTQGQIFSQQPVTVKPGDRIRMTVNGMPDLTGRYERSLGDSVAILMGRNKQQIKILIPTDRIIKIEVPQESRYNPFQKVLLGTLIGASAGALFGLIVPDRALDNGGFYFWTRGGTVLLWGSVGAGGGLVSGLVISGVTREKWIPATIAGKPQINNPHYACISIGWSIRFGR